MRALNTALNKIQNEIPEAILELVFTSSKFLGHEDHRSLEEIIKNDVIRSKVMLDCNMVGGQEAVVDFHGLTPRDVRDGYLLRIPAEKRQGRDIMSVLELLSHVDEGNNNLNRLPGSRPQYEGSLINKANNMLEENTSQPVTASNNVWPTETNVIFIKSGCYMPSMGILVTLANDDNLANINIRNHLDFANLCLVACQGMIYNKLRLKINETSLYSGSSSGAIREVVDSYSDAHQRYDDLMLDWRKISIMNDPNSRATMIGMGLR